MVGGGCRPSVYLFSSLCVQVVRAKKKDTGMVYAMKIMDKTFITKENKTAYVKLERIVLDQLDHPGIVRLYFTFQDSCSLCKYSLVTLNSVSLPCRWSFREANLTFLHLTL